MLVEIKAYNQCKEERDKLWLHNMGVKDISWYHSLREVVKVDIHPIAYLYAWAMYKLSHNLTLSGKQFMFELFNITIVSSDFTEMPIGKLILKYSFSTFFNDLYSKFVELDPSLSHIEYNIYIEAGRQIYETYRNAKWKEL